MKVWKYDNDAGEVREVEGGEYPATDSEGDTCYQNTHFMTREAAVEYLIRDALAGLNLATACYNDAKDNLRLKQERCADAGLYYSTVVEKYKAGGGGT